MNLINDKAIGSKKGKLIPKLKGRVQPKAGSSRFNFLINCKHDLKNTYGCPMCRLVHSVTKKHFEIEKEQLRLDHEQSLVNRAQLRLTLILRWARTQSVLYNKYIGAPTFDIVFSRSLASVLIDEDAVMSREQPIDFDEIVKVLERRNRIQEVGHFAAIYLQSRIRKYLAKRLVRRIVLQRFEYVPATRRKQAFYIDTYWSRKKERTPLFLQQELPATPRTIGRRLAADDRVRASRYEAFKKDVVRRYQAIEGADVWAQEETTVRFLKQMGVLRDLVRIAMLNITRARLQREAVASSEKQTMELRRSTTSTPGGIANTPGAALNRRGSVTNRISILKQAEESTAIAAAATLSTDFNTVDSEAILPLQPVWISLSAPNMSARDMGMALALATVPSPATGLLKVRNTGYGPRSSAAAAPTSAGGMLEVIPPAPMGGGRDRAVSFSVPSPMPGTPSGKFSRTNTATSSVSRALSPGLQTPPRTPSKPTRQDSGTGSAVVSVAQLHRSLHFLEHSIWQCLKCSSPEEVLTKLLLEDLRPTLVSVMNITQEDKNIWRGKLGHQPSSRATARREDRRHSRGGHSEESSIGSDDRSGSSDSDAEVGEDEDEEFTREVLPLTLQLRPFYPERGCNGFFRLFFYMDELVAASAVSPWVFYPEVLKNRDMINNSIRAYAALPTTRSFIQQFLTRANINTIGQDLSGLGPSDLQPIAALSRGVAGVNLSSKVTSGSSSKVTLQRRPSVSLNSANPPGSAGGGARRKSLMPPAINTTSSSMERGPELTHLFAPPEELIFAGTAPDRAAINRMRDISQFSDEKTIQMSAKYKFMSKNTAFVERLKRAEHNAATRQKRRGAATHTTHAAVPSKAFMENSPFHQRRVRLEEWFANDAHISPAVLFRGPLESEVNAQLLKDLHAVKNDLLGGKLLRLLLGPEAAGGDPAEDSINVFGTSSQHEAPAAGPYAHSPDLRSSTPSAEAVVGSSPEERELPEYEAKLHRYSTKTRVEIMERLRRPTDVPRVKELFPMVVMDVYVHLPGKAGLGTPGTPSALRRNATGVSVLSGGPDMPSTPTGAAAAGGGGGYVGASPGGPSAGAGAAGLFAVDLQQIVGAFTCDCDRPPPNLDCGLADWDHFHALHKSRSSSMFPASLSGFNEGSSSNSVGSASSKGSGSTANARTNYWTTPSTDTGVSTYLSNLPSGLQYQFRMLANPPSKPYLERTLPKKVKEWVGLPV